jgi:hypothetical protein
MPTLSEAPKLYLTNRANRLERLCRLDAPVSLLRSEVLLILEAMTAILKAEPPVENQLTAFSVTTAPDIINRCMDMLADVPGETLEDRVSKLVGYYLELQLLRRERKNLCPQ